MGYQTRHEKTAMGYFLIGLACVVVMLICYGISELFHLGWFTK